MEADLNDLTKRTLRIVLAREFELGFDALSTHDWNWVKETVLPFVKSELEYLSETDDQLERLVRSQWARAKAYRITQELSTEGLFERVR